MRPARWITFAALVALLGCGTESGDLGEETSTADTAPIGSDVGTTGTDATAAPVPGDSGIIEGSHP